MKTVCLIRHAHALNEHPQGDFYRELSPRGQQEAKALGFWLKNQAVADIIYLSPAQRTEATATVLLCSAQFLTPKIIRQENFYQASAETWLAALKNLYEKQESVWIIGHNPGLEHLAMMWQEQESGGMGTAEVRVFSLTNWQAAGKFLKRYRPTL